MKAGGKRQLGEWRPELGVYAGNEALLSAGNPTALAPDSPPLPLRSAGSDASGSESPQANGSGWRPGYTGGKGQDGVWQRIIGQMPPHSVYVEAFAGSAAIFFHKRPAARSVLIDASAGVVLELEASVPTHGAGEVIQGDALDILPTLALPADAVVYCDPPYLLETRNGRRYYGEHELSDDQHGQLLRVLKELPCRVLLSGYPSEIYGAALRDWRCLEYRVRTRQRTVTECLWMNFTEPAELHDWRFAGRNFRERLALKRLATRWVSRLQAMPARKRGYVLNALAMGPRVEPGAADPQRRE